ncbi:hypothetical protein [uncultured Jannaschia sp.]|uniref:hypothetical protein n=1 Tax=uncultured Jannaschia sp. TaxID=293347 RepID=UPI0026292A0A|nr:hypothetical protein [uncultured Jannaschia sp.]
MKGIAEPAAAYRDGSPRPTTVVAEVQTRIVARDPVLNAFADRCRGRLGGDAALPSVAAAIEARLAG